MMAILDDPLIGTWRIDEADLWDRGYLDLVEPASITIRADGHGEIAFGHASEADLNEVERGGPSSSLGRATKPVRSTRLTVTGCTGKHSLSY